MDERISKCWGGGLTPRKAARGTFSLEDFQLMVDPLDTPEDLVKEMKVSVNLIWSTVF